MRSKLTSKPTVGVAIRAKREPQMSMRELARRCGISAPYLSDIEHGNRSPSMAVMENIAAALGDQKLVARYVAERIGIHMDAIRALKERG